MGRTTRPVLVALLALLLGPLPVSDARAADDAAPAARAGCLGHAVEARGHRQHRNPLAPCPGIRPGGALVERVEDVRQVYCTMAFIVTDGTDRYVATAAHCVEPGARVAAHGVPGTFGTVAFRWCEGSSLNGTCDAGTDFALIRIDPDRYDYVRREMCHWGAASDGLFGTRDGETRQIRYFGWGAGAGSAVVGGTVDGNTVQPGNPATQARVGQGLSFNRDRYVWAQGLAVSGDSGSGVLVTDSPTSSVVDPVPTRALGVLTHFSAGGILVVQRLDDSLARAGADSGRTFSLW